MIGTIKKVIDLLDWGRSLFVKAKEKYHRFIQRRRAEKIDRAFGDGDIEYVNGLLRQIKQRRVNRNNES